MPDLYVSKIQLLSKSVKYGDSRCQQQREGLVDYGCQ